MEAEAVSTPHWVSVFARARCFVLVASNLKICLLLSAHFGMCAALYFISQVDLYPSLFFCRYPGGLKERSAELQFEKDPTEILRKAVYGMLPKNKLRDVSTLQLFWE